MRLEHWAAAKIAADGTVIAADAGIELPLLTTKISTGVYELTLVNELGVSEACPEVTPWYTGITIPSVKTAATLSSDGKKLTVNITAGDPGAPVDSAFCVVLWRFSPS